MEIKYNLTEEDYINFNMYHMKNSKSANRSLNIQRFFMPIVLLISSYVFSNIMDSSFTVYFGVFLIMSILWIVFFPKYFYSHVIRHVKKMIKEGKNDGLLGEHSLVMSEEGVVDSNSNGETKVTWAGIKDFKEDNYYFYLYNSAVSACILPKREIKNVEEVSKYIKSKLIH